MSLEYRVNVTLKTNRKFVTLESLKSPVGCKQIKLRRKKKVNLITQPKLRETWFWYGEARSPSSQTRYATVIHNNTFPKNSHIIIN